MKEINRVRSNPKIYGQELDSELHKDVILALFNAKPVKALKENKCL